MGSGLGNTWGKVPPEHISWAGGLPMSRVTLCVAGNEAALAHNTSAQNEHLGRGDDSRRLQHKRNEDTWWQGRERRSPLKVASIPMLLGPFCSGARMELLGVCCD